MLDADKTSGEQADKKYRVLRNGKEQTCSMQITEILDGIKKLTNMPDLRFRYYKNFRSISADESNINEQVP